MAQGEVERKARMSKLLLMLAILWKCDIIL